MKDEKRTHKTPVDEQPDDDRTVVIEVGDSSSTPPTEREAHGDGTDAPAADGVDEPAADGIDAPAADGVDEPAGDGVDEPAGDTEKAGGKRKAGVPLAEQLEASRAETAARHDDWLRALAEIENLRKRGARERSEQVRRARESVLCEFLAVVDDVERAIDAIAQSDLGPEAESLSQGVELIHTRLLDVLAGFDVRPMECEGEAFDPHQHEAVMRDESSELEPDHITQVMQQGYRIGERVLRPARVAVSS